MSKSRKPTRKELLKEPDEFLSFSRKMLQTAVAYRKPILAAAAVFFGLLIAFAAFQYQASRSENRAFVLLEQAASAYTAAAADPEAQAARSAAIENFERLLDRYANKTAGRIGRVIYADICYREGQPQKAAALYDQALDHFKETPSLGGLIRSGMGYAWEAADNLEKAAAAFQQVADGTDAVFKDNALFQLARIYRKMGRHEEEARALERISEQHPASLFAPIAKEKAVQADGA